MVGIAVAIMVESRATRKVQLQRDRKMRMSFRPAGYCVVGSLLEVSFCFSERFSGLESWAGIDCGGGLSMVVAS